MSRLKYFLLLFFSGISVWVTAQRDVIHFENIGRENGLAQSTINGILQGKEGFMWFATAEGLHRFDGYEFKVFKHDARDSTSLSNNHITTIYEDSRGYIWVGTYTGEVNRFDKITHKFQKFRIRDQDLNENRYSITCIRQSAENELLVGLDGGGMISINMENGSYKSYLKENSKLPNNYVNCFAPELNGLGVWVGTDQGIILYHNGIFKEFSSLELFFNQNVNGILQHGSMVYIATRGQGLQVWDVRKDYVLPIPSPRIRGTNLTNFVVHDNSGNLWIGTDGGGLMKFNGDTYVTYRNNPYNYRSLIGDQVNCGFMDRQGILWFGCINGISKYDPNLQLFNLFENFEYEGEPTNNIVYSIFESRDKTIWLGTLGSGLAAFNPKTEELKVYASIRDEKANIETKAVRAIFEDSYGVLWVGSRDEGLFSFNRQTEKFEHHSPSNPEIKQNEIRCIMEDSEGRMWIGTRWGLVEYLRDEDDFKLYPSRFLNNNPIYQILEDKSRKELLLVTFRSGLHIYNKEKNAFTVLQHGNDSTSPSVNSMMCIDQITRDSFIIGTYGGGLNIFDRKNQSFSAINSNDGLPNDVVYGILKENRNVFWLSTNDGLIRYDRKSNSFTQFNMSHYLQGLEFNEGAYWKASDGTFYFGGQNGFNYFQPESIIPKSKPQPVVLTAFRVLDQEVKLPVDINYRDKLEIRYNEDLISFEFASLSFTNSHENTYEYWLEGYDEDWIKSGKRRAAYYGHLSPGMYTFRVRAINHDGVRSDGEKVIQIIVHPPYWQTWWFRILVGAIILALIGLIFFLRTKAISRSYKHKLVDLELQALRSQMNPHFIFNSLNSIQYFVLKNEPKAAYTYLTKFSTLMRMILQNSGVKYISLKDETEWLTTYLELEKLRLENELEFQIDVAEDLNPKEIMIPSMLIQPYVENAIIHGLLPKNDERKLTVQFSRHGEHIHCVIEDNGIGRAKSRELNEQRTRKYKSQGIKLTGERLEILTQDLKVKPELKIIDLFENGEAAGTRVVLGIPIILKSENAED
ncbi:MAG: hypothetical protein GC181_13190 [Bacteroidetes bacterium]|nr:hypothetical protein [Bacteroidota bacterium]